MNEVTEWVGGYPVHPVASLFPMIKGDELQALADDIKANGQYEPILLASYDMSDPDGLFLLDGRNRFKACELAGVEPIFREEYTLPKASADEGAVFITPESAGEWVIAHNLERRHLTPSQRSMIGQGYLEYQKALAKARQSEAGREYGNGKLPRKSVEATDRVANESAAKAGKLVGVSRDSIRDADYVVKTSPELAREVRDGKIAVSAAAKKLREKAKPAPTQEELAERQRKLVAREVARLLKQGDLFAAQVRDGLIEALNQKEEVNA